MLNIAVILLAIDIIILAMFTMIAIIDLKRDIKINYALNQSICAYLHKNYGITVEEMKDIYYEDYLKTGVDFIEKQ